MRSRRNDGKTNILVGKKKKKKTVSFGVYYALGVIS